MAFASMLLEAWVWIKIIKKLKIVTFLMIKMNFFLQIKGYYVILKVRL